MTNIKDIAKHCGVGIGTVSRVINNHPNVSEKTRTRVNDALRELKYVPNNSARNLVRTAAETVALIVRGVGNLFFSQVIREMARELEHCGFTVAFTQISSDDDELHVAALLTREKNLKGIIFLGGRHNYSEEDISLIGVPFVCCTYTNEFGSLGKSSYSSVSIDDEAVAMKAVELLIEKGHSKIGVIIAHENDNSISELRYKGYCRALKSAKIEPNPALVIKACSFSMNDAYDSVVRLIKSKEEFSALFVISDAMAISAISALQDNGIGVPENCSVVAIDGLDISKYVRPMLTTMEQPIEKIAKQSVEILSEIIEDSSKNRHVLLESGIRQGGTVAKKVKD